MFRFKRSQTFEVESDVKLKNFIKNNCYFCNKYFITLQMKNRVCFELKRPIFCNLSVDFIQILQTAKVKISKMIELQAYKIRQISSMI